ncbi:MAG: hypothetical protein WDM91_04100 [Rhizomicrobium sp.]
MSHRPVWFVSLCIAATLALGSAQAQNRLPREPRSTITVLVDLSGTWFNPASEADNRKVLSVIADAVSAAATEIEPPIAVRYLAIGDRSLARTPLCEAVYAPNILSVKSTADSLVNLKQLRDFAAKDCPLAIFLHAPEKFTDISGALDTVARMSAYDTAGFHALVVLSDFQEDRRRQQSGGFGALTGMHAVMLYRVLDSDRLDPRSLDQRIHKWEGALRHSGATVSSIDDVGLNAGLLKRLLLR